MGPCSSSTFISYTYVFSHCLHWCYAMELPKEYPYVLTISQCKCLGSFRQTSPDFYDFDLIDVQNYRLQGQDSSRYTITKTLVNAHCRPSLYAKDVFVFDIAGMKIKETFPKDSLSKIKMTPIHRSITDEKLSFISLTLNCLLIVVKDKKTSTSELITMDPVRCARQHCASLSIKQEADCEQLYVAILSLALECAYFEGKDGKEERGFTVASSPIICNNALWGISTSLAGEYLLWARLDLEPNNSIYAELRAGSKTSTFHNVPNFLPVLIFYWLFKSYFNCIITHVSQLLLFCLNVFCFLMQYFCGVR
ncbi:uncharacterized protein LOC106672330 [Cimex lectularius]|uniref:Uncharacterized protein n=1 Tax=Cimex lectularius TaxID=79782 RepID=A0A8I6TK66_CIMLE|nr:uncharacterized protein LOC106672330 [Cimex lectularius]